MADLFISFLDRSIAAGWLVLVILLLRLVLKKAPKWTRPALWALVGLRLILPEIPVSPLSLIPSGQTVSPEIMLSPEPAVTSGVPLVNIIVNNTLRAHFAPNPATSANPLQLLFIVAAQFWLLGILLLLGYSAVSYLRLRRRVRDGVPHSEGVFLSEHIPSPFLLGIWKPKIYLPYFLEESAISHVLAHEQAHIRRRDHWWKPLGFLLLAVYWFHPLMWVAYILLCRDIELACDEAVIREMGPSARADYSQALLRCSTHKSTISACPLAFGETGIRQRIRSVLNYKKPGRILIATGVLLLFLVSVCFLTNPTGDGGIGIQNIRIVSHPTAAAALELDYLLMEKSGYTVRAVPQSEGEYTGSGIGEYDGALGPYRILISFGDTEPSEGFRQKYPAGEVIALENLPEHFLGSYLKFKVVSPQDHGFAIYVGSDRPFAFKESVLYNLRY